MPIDPTVALHSGEGVSQAIGQAGQLAGIQNAVNQARLFNLQLAGRQRAGELIAQAPDLETGLRAAETDPTAVGYAGEVINTLRQAYQTQVATQGEQQKQYASAAHAVVANGLIGARYPDQFKLSIQRTMAAMPASVRTAIQPFVDSYVTSMTGGLDLKTPEGLTGLQRNLAAASVAAGVNKDTIDQMFPTTSLVDVGDRLQPLLTQPGWAGGGVSLAPGPSLAKGVAPSYQSPDTIPAPGLPGGTNGLRAGGMPPVPPPPANALGLRPPSATAPQTIGGKPILSAAQQTLVDNQAKDFATKDTDQYHADMAAMPLHDSIENSIMHLAHANKGAEGSSLLVPGAFGESRLRIAQMANTLAQMFGQKPPIDPTDVGEAENLIKQSWNLAFGSADRVLGQSHQASETINNIFKTVPGIDGSFLGMAMINDWMRTMRLRRTAMHEFQTQWVADPANKGDLTNSDVAFNKLYPPEQVANQVLGKYGLDNRGFTSPKAVYDAVNRGLINKDIGATILTRQWPDQFVSPAKQ